MEKVKQRKAADLTDDAATYPTGLCEKKKNVVWLYQILSNGWK